MNSDLERAKTLLNSGEYTCILCRDNEIYTSKNRGVSPLIQWLEDKINLKDFSAADKIVGRAAAFLYILMGVREVYAPVMSLGAVSLLRGKGIKAHYNMETKAIINRTKTDICPMEQAVEKITSPNLAFDAIKQRLKEIQTEK